MRELRELSLQLWPLREHRKLPFKKLTLQSQGMGDIICNIHFSVSYSERANLNFLAHFFFFIFRTATARGKAEQSDMASIHARDDARSDH